MAFFIMKAKGRFRILIGAYFILLLYLTSLVSSLSKDAVAMDFHSFEIVQPVITTAAGVRSRRAINSPMEIPSKELTVSILAFGQDFLIDLKMNQHLLPQKYFEKHHFNGDDVLTRPMTKVKEHCHYQGSLRRIDNSWAALSVCNGISGVIHDNNETFYIEPQSESKDGNHIFMRASDMKDKNLTCGTSGSEHDSGIAYLHRVRRFATVLQEPYKSNSTSRYVELIIVNDNKEFKERNRNKDDVFERSKQIANIVNGLYRPLNIFIALVGVEVWSEQDEIVLSADGDATLNNFLHYRRERLAQKHPHDNAQLITALKFEGGVVGKALKGPICTYEFSGGVNMDHSPVVGLVATTVAHELGHNFGMEHDAENCKCPDEKCIMSPSSGPLIPRHWSSCSIEYLQHAFTQGMDYCLRNQPKVIFGPVCGNGFLENGEQCDCGLKEYCDNPCCNATTCRLHPNASCATGGCCDIQTCQVKRASYVCRDSITECDLPEFCDGRSEFCPSDVYLQDGTECGSRKAYCFQGKCQSHSDQCQLLWGSTGQVSEQFCFEQNTFGNVSGNCGYNKPNKTFYSCSKSNIMCGRLHCIHLNERLEFGIESAAILAHSFMQHRGKTLICRSAIVDLGLQNTDPGLTPNGAKCGTNRACLNQKCVAVEKLRGDKCKYKCNYNGVCNNRGHCHCSVGYGPPFCDIPGPGGSEDSGPASDPDAGYQFLVAMYIIFLCIVPLAALTAFGIYYFRRHLKMWWITKARKAAIKSRAKQVAQRKPRPPSRYSVDLRNVEISSPLPGDIPTSTLTRGGTNKGSHNRSSLRDLEISLPIPQSTTNGAVGKLIPVRPAPPRPDATPKRTPSWAPGGNNVSNGFATVIRSTSLRGPGDVRPTSIPSARPHCPPPPRPPPPKAGKPDILSPDGENVEKLDFSNTMLAFVHHPPQSPTDAIYAELSNGANGTAATDSKASAVNETSFNRNRSNVYNLKPLPPLPSLSTKPRWPGTTAKPQTKPVRTEATPPTFGSFLNGPGAANAGTKPLLSSKPNYPASQPSVVASLTQKFEKTTDSGRSQPAKPTFLPR